MMRCSGNHWERTWRIAWLIGLCLLGLVWPRIASAQFQLLWQIREPFHVGEFLAGDYYMAAFRNNDRTIILYRLSSEGILTPLWSHTEPLGNYLGSVLIDVDPAAGSIFLRVMGFSRDDLWALDMAGNFQWVVHSSRPPYYPTYPTYDWLHGDGAGGVVERQISERWRLLWYSAGGMLSWSRNLSYATQVRMDPLNRLLMVHRITNQYHTVGLRYEWYMPIGRLIRAVEWYPPAPLRIGFNDMLIFDPMGGLYHLMGLYDGQGLYQEIVLALSPEGQVRWVAELPVGGSVYFDLANNQLLVLSQDSYPNERIALHRFDADTGELIDGRILHETDRVVDSVQVALDERFLYLAVHEGHMERYCDPECCEDYFVLDELVLVRFTLQGAPRARMSLNHYIGRMAAVQGNLWLFAYSGIRCYKLLAVRADGDIDGNGCVDDSDLLKVLFAFGQTGTGLPEDINEDGMVNDLDLMEILFSFGLGC